LIIEHNTTQAPFTFHVSGFGTASVLSLPNQSLFIDTCVIGLTVVDSFEVRNDCNRTLIVSRIISRNPIFTVSTTPFAVLPYQTRYIRVSYTPQDQSAHEGYISLLTSGGTDSVWVHNEPCVLDHVSRTSEVPHTFSLEQNYPNPFNPLTEIRYGVPRSSQVKLEVMDILGRQVAVLAEGQSDAGIFTARWNGTGYSSGIYILRMQTGEQTFIRKMMLLK
jgi:hypothetical protein